MPDQHTTDVAKLYDTLAANGPYGTLAPDNRGGRKSRYVSAVFDAALLPMLERNASPNDVLLDYGCGTGIFSVKAARHVGRVVGLDVSESMLEWGRRLNVGNLPIDWMQGDGTTVRLQADSVDWIVARESLCYVPTFDLDGVVKELFRVLRPGGRFLWLEQVSDNPALRAHRDAPLLEKRPASLLLDVAERAGFVSDYVACVRSPRFPWIYPIWAGLVPEAMIPALARWEVAWNRRFGKLSGGHWRDALLTFRKEA